MYGYPAMTYSESALRKIAQAIDAPISRVELHADQFENAALWYRSFHKSFEGRTPKQLQTRLGKIAKAARKLLKCLGVEKASAAPDGPGDREIFIALANYPVDSTEDLVVEATRQIGRFVEILDAVGAAQTLEGLASDAVPEVKALGEATVPKGNPGDYRLIMWTAAMMDLYEKITNSRPATSVGSSGPNEGEPGGPLIRFLTAAGAPIGISKTPDAWRSRVRQILESTPEKN